MSKPHFLCTIDDCDRVKEGNTPYCSTHNHGFRKMARDLSKPVAPPKPLKRSAIRKVSPKRAEQNLEYAGERNAWIEGKKCVACGDPATEVHHAAGRTNDLLLEKKYWKPVCRPCHVLITEDSAWAIQNGWSLPRTV